MKIILVMVSSLDGKITWGEDPDIHQWTSKEDQDYFHNLIETNSLVVMGRKTYEAASPRPQAGKLRIVVTNNPDKFKDKSIAGQLEFTNEPVKVLAGRLQ